MRIVVTLAASLLVAGSALVPSAQAFTIDPDILGTPLIDPGPIGPTLDPGLITPIDPPGPDPVPDPDPGWDGWGGSFGITIAPPIMAPQPRVQQDTSQLLKAHIAYCVKRWKTYDVSTDMYNSNHGPRRCVSPATPYL